VTWPPIASDSPSLRADGGRGGRAARIDCERTRAALGLVAPLPSLLLHMHFRTPRTVPATLALDGPWCDGILQL
jgi:hypothetical protein